MSTVQALQRNPRQLATVMHLRREIDEELRHFLLGKVLKRIRAFSSKYDMDGDGLAHSRQVEKDFVRDSDHDYMIIVALNNELQMVGHLLARASIYYGKLYIYIEQMEIDKGARVTLEQERQAYGWVKNWQVEIKADGIRSAVPSAAQVRRLRMLHGMEPFLTVMREVKGG